MTVSRQLLSNDIIGRGFNYPFHINTNTGGVDTTTNTENIVQSIVHILDVNIGEYIGSRAFGSNVYDLIYTINDDANDPLLQHFVVDALDKWEPRVQITGVIISREKYREGILEISIDFMVLQTHQSASMVYPFYLAQEE